MDILKDRVKPLYFKYLVAASGSAMVASIFGMIDAMMVGKYHGPSGNAAIAIFTPVWSFVYSLGIFRVLGVQYYSQINVVVEMKKAHRNILACQSFMVLCSRFLR